MLKTEVVFCDGGQAFMLCHIHNIAPLPQALRGAVSLSFKVHVLMETAVNG